MFRIVILTIMLCQFASTVRAETYRLGYKDAIALALEINSRVRAAGFTADVARYGIAIAGADYYPHLAFEEGFTSSNAPTRTFMMKLDQGRFSQNDFQIQNLNSPGTYHDFRSAVSLQQSIYNPATGPAREMAVKDSEKQSLGSDATRQETAFRVFRIYLEVQKSGARFRAAEQSIADARENMRLATVRTAAGVGLRSDELRARTHLSAMEQRLIATHNDLQLAGMMLQTVVGLPDDSRITVADAPVGISLALLPEELVKSALENRTDLKQSQAELEKAAAAVRLARSDYFPKVDAFASYQLNAKEAPFGADNNSWIAGMALRWQLFDGFRTSRETDRAVAGQSAAAAMKEDRAREIRYQVRESYLRREETGKRLEVARHALLDAEETVRLLTRRFENSLATMVELLDAQTVLNQLRADLAETESEYALSTGNVYYVAGIFLKEMLK